MKILDLRVVIIVVTAVCIFASSASAVLLTAESTVSAPIDDGAGGVYYKYTINLEWDFSDGGFQNGISHWEIAVCDDIALKDPVTGEVTDDIWFEDAVAPALTGIDGRSTPDGEGGPEDVLWFGSTDTPFNTIKYEQPLLYDGPAPVLTEPGVSGEGTFWFYSTIAPVEVINPISIGAKANTAIFNGTLSWDWMCVPEPATLILLTLGSLVVARKRR